MWRGALLSLLVVLPQPASAQPVPLPFPNATLQQYRIPDCRETNCNRQVVEPDHSLARWGTGAGAEWARRVRTDASYNLNAPENASCTGAVRALFKLICDNAPNCEIEARYEEKCLASSPNAKTKEACANVVKAYVTQCFGNGCPHEITGLVGGALQNHGERPFCSAAGLVYKPPSNSDPGRPVAVTVDHCESRIKSGTRFSRYRALADDELAGKIQNPAQFVPAVRTYNVEQKARYPLGIARPLPFAKTFFQGYNSLIASYNLLVAGDEKKLSPLYCDSSSLCTIVRAEGGKLLHTCQSTRGGSGGALVQEINGARVVVGVNNGSPSTGQVSENDGFPILRTGP